MRLKRPGGPCPECRRRWVLFPTLHLVGHLLDRLGGRKSPDAAVLGNWSGTCPEPGGCASCPEPRACARLRAELGLGS